jgi:CubicO group peptidase (beta-lactamase class C family)
MQTHPIHTRKNKKTFQPPHQTENGGFSPVRLARMHAAMQRYVDSGWAPGLVTLVYRKGQVQVDAIGTMAFNSDVPMQRDTIFRLASMTKPITAVAAMMLLEECRLRLDDPVEEWLPELKDRKVLRTIESPLAMEK